ncbi:PREDICTED: uncharacterized protein LOC103330599 [Prunus mume]|uniref:Uncharacterized protein LOC103330599 n=1 Tax=Prunus mume TaxID=102107 RepID=A0ABM0NXV1_PRUMU|nr:PREDICTED: uncharacterized protein LOC103330599 [Prunus mume]
MQMLSIQPGNLITAVLLATSTALKILFDGWDSWVVHAGEKTHRFMVQTIKDINAQVIEDPSLTKNVGGQSVQAGEVIVTSVISAGDLELPSRDEEDEVQIEQTAVEATPLGRRNQRKETAPVHGSAAQPASSAAPTTTSGTYEELREAFEVAEQEKELEEEEGPQEKTKEMEEEKQQEAPRVELTSSELALFEDAEAEHSTAILAPEKQAKQSMPIHSLPGSSATASYADLELAEFEATPSWTSLRNSALLLSRESPRRWMRQWIE